VCGAAQAGIPEEHVVVLGAIIGDVIGSVFERQNVKTTHFELFNRFTRFTDDTVLTVAVADSILHRDTHAWKILRDHRNREIYARKIKSYGRRFPDAGYGQMFKEWLESDSLRGYHSYGNGSAMRVSPIGFAFERLEDVLREAKLSADVTHNHPEGIQGAQAVAGAVFLARTTRDKSAVRTFVEQRIGYDLSRRLDAIRPTYVFDSSCRASIPPAITAFLESTGFEDAIRKAISLGGDSDTIACIAGGVAQAYYGTLPERLAGEVSLRLDSSFRAIIRQFNERFAVTG
jgi:ADP-ribosylglycohydrolase